MNNSETSIDSTNKPCVASKSRPEVIATLALTQLLVTLALFVVMFFCTDTRNALSALLGGIIAAAANLYIALSMLTAKNRPQAVEMLARFYTSVVLKGLFTLTMMAISIIVIKVSIAPFIITYLLIAVAVNWVFLLVPTNDVVVWEDHKEAHHEKI